MDSQKHDVKSVKLTKKDIRKSFILWYMITEMSSSYERLQSLSFCACLTPILKKLYSKKEDLSAALTRHLQFFNTEGIWGCLIHGITIALEEQKANGEDIPDETITGLKTGLMGPFAGIGDTIDWGTLKPIIYALGVSVAMTGSGVGGFIVFLFPLITFILGYYIWNLGYTLGKDSIKTVLQGGLVQELITGSSILGLFMMGALSANYVKLSTPLTITLSNAKPFPVQDIFDKIAPGILPLAVIFAIYLYLSKKEQSYNKVLIAILVVSLLGSLVGIF